MKHEKVGVGEVDEWRGDEYDSVYLLKAQHMYFSNTLIFEASQRIKKGAGFPIAERGSVR